MNKSSAQPDNGPHLPPEDAARLAELGYDAEYFRRLAKVDDSGVAIRDTLQQLHKGTLEPRNRNTSASFREEARATLAFWLVMVVGAVVYFAFIFGAQELFALVRGRYQDDAAIIFPTWVAVLLVVVPFALFDAVALWRGRELLKGAPGFRPEELQWTAADTGFRPVPPVLRELTALPLLTMIPIIMAQQGVPHMANPFLQIVTLLLLGASAMSMALAGGPLPAAVLVACWAGWAWIALHGNSTWPTAGLLVVTLIVGIPYFGKLIKVRAAMEAQALAAEGSAP